MSRMKLLIFLPRKTPPTIFPQFNKQPPSFHTWYTSTVCPLHQKVGSMSTGALFSLGQEQCLTQSRSCWTDATPPPGSLPTPFIRYFSHLTELLPLLDSTVHSCQCGHLHDSLIDVSLHRQPQPRGRQMLLLWFQLPAANLEPGTE